MVICQILFYTKYLRTDCVNIKLPLGEFVVEFKEDLDAGKTLGYFKESEHIIQVSTKQHKYQQKTTLLHELLHGAETATTIKLTEKQIDALSYYLLFLLRNNPDLINYIVEPI